jgi:pimeloyl-ACP methyl ester carboxylesterase
LRFKIGRALAARGLLSEEKIEAMRRRYGSDDYRAATGVMREVLVRALSEDYNGVLEGLSCPVELVWGDNDAEAPLSVGEQLDCELAHAHLVVCKGAGHLTPLTAPGELRAALERLRP